jgi:2-oxoacid:acceptor oxidoreductase gamma subunit (pyruvate/2-ketoisovalerate family)
MRFHGRGGQGMKTASRIVGSAAFHAGFVVQDAPVYGAERRGAPLAAFTRMARQSILDRGAITHPDLVVVADDTLLTDPAAQPLAGCDPQCTVLLNSVRDDAALLPLMSHGGRLVAADFTSLVLAHTTTLAALSTALGVAAACLVGLTPSQRFSHPTGHSMPSFVVRDRWRKGQPYWVAPSTVTSATNSTWRRRMLSQCTRTSRRTLLPTSVGITIWSSRFSSTMPTMSSSCPMPLPRKAKRPYSAYGHAVSEQIYCVYVSFGRFQRRPLPRR